MFSASAQEFLYSYRCKLLFEFQPRWPIHLHLHLHARNSTPRACAHGHGHAHRLELSAKMDAYVDMHFISCSQYLSPIALRQSSSCSFHLITSFRPFLCPFPLMQCIVCSIPTAFLPPQLAHMYIQMLRTLRLRVHMDWVAANRTC